MSSALNPHRGRSSEHRPQAKAKPFAFTQDTRSQDTSADGRPRTVPEKGVRSISPNAGGRPQTRQAPFAHHNSDGEDVSANSAKTPNGVNFVAVGGGASTALGQAAIHGLDALKVELKKSGCGDINTGDGMKATPLMLAIDSCSVLELGPVVEMLLLHGSDVNAADCGGDTPLIYCVQRSKPSADSPLERVQFEPGMLQCTKLLLDHKADPEIANIRSRQNALQICANLQGSAERSPLGRTCLQELKLRKLEASLPIWHQGEEIPRPPKGFEEALSDATKNGHRRVAAYLKAYSRSLEVLRNGIKLDFPPDDVGFIPASGHNATKPLRDALSAADAFLRDHGPLPEALHNLVFDGLLPLQKDLYRQYIERYSTKEAQEALVRFVAANKDAYLHGYEWAFRELIETNEKQDLDASVALAEKFPAGKGEAKPRQKVAQFADVMTGAFHMHRRVQILCSKVAKAGKGTHEVVHGHDGGRGEPNQKGMFRAHEKVCLGSGFDGILDCSRGGIECPSMGGVRDALQALLDASERGEIRLLRIKMRFHEPSDGGWRDALVNFVFADDPREHVCELQVIHEKMMTIRADMGAHHGYDKFRGALELLIYHNVDIDAVIAELEKRDQEEILSRTLSSTQALSMTLPSESLSQDGASAARVKELEEQLQNRDAQVAELEKQLKERDDHIASLQASTAKSAKKPRSVEEQVLAAFKRWDVNGDGTISRGEVADMFSKIDPSFTDDDFDKLFASADTDGNGKIDYHEFVMFIFQATSTANGAGVIA